MIRPAYYNEIDEYAAQWLRNLIAAGLIPAGDVDTRSIVDVRADDLAGYGQCHFFAGLGGWPLALLMAGWPEDLEVWTGSCPCQPFSAAGKRAGFDDERHLWPEWLRLISQRRPAVLFGEQVAGATEWVRVVRGDLEAVGYAVGAIPIEATCVGARFGRDRFWIVADAERDEQPRQEPRRRPAGRMGRLEQSVPWNADSLVAFARLRTLDDGLPRCVAGTDAARNAIVPQVAAEVIGAWLDAEAERYMERAA